jgi:uncharacterized NAD-dependent epimerase/dehydratase family protein
MTSARMITESLSRPAPLRIAIVDTGIDAAHPDLARVARGVRLLVEGGEVRQSDDWTDASGHGTACAGIVSRGLTTRIELLAVRLVDGERGSSPLALAEAIRWAAAEGARVINISLGAETWKDETSERVEAACREATQRGVVIVAAAGPEGKEPLPAILPDVVAVGAAFCPSDVLYAADEGYVELLARGDLQRVAWLSGGSVLAQGASFSAAHVSRAACKILLAEPSLDAAGVRRALLAQCIQGDTGFRQRWKESFEAFYRRRTPAHVGFLRRVALYPFNKEIHALVRFRDLAPFTLAAVADPPGGRRCGRDAAEAIGEPPAGLVVRPDLDGALEEADSLVLGHVEAQQGLGSRGGPATIVRRALELGKSVFSLSRLDPGEHADLFALAAQKGLTITDPTVTRKEVNAVMRAATANPADPSAAGRRFADGRLAAQVGALMQGATQVLRHDCPVLGVFGTSRSQGKFSLQLSLRRALSRLGYHVSQLSTEPTGALLGASATLPLGFERGEGLGLETDAHLVRLVVTEIKNRERPDVLILGGQSGVVSVSREIDRLGLGSLGALSFGAAAQPDACVLVCNVFDPPRHVRRSIGALESVLDCKVIALALNDQVWEDHAFRGTTRRRLARLPESALREQARTRAAELGLPCHPALGEEGTRALAEAVVEFFAAPERGES